MPASRPRLADALGHAPADRRIDILRAIAATGSISQAARDVGVSYKAAWQALDTLTNLAGVPLVARAVGGAGGGGAVVTAAGLELLALADALHAARQRVLGAGAPPAGALGLRTSMRNQWPCRVRSIEAGGAIARVRLRLGAPGGGDGNDVRDRADMRGAAPIELVARVTRESAELLALHPGQPVLALCKATAVRIAPLADDAHDRAQPCGNRLEGGIERITRGEQADEVSLRLAPAVHLVGFAEAGAIGRGRRRAVARLDETALVVALAG